ncbi:MAG TPA: ABC transporter family substrate-binding protein [Pseudonocardia sp.]|jgi:peptide/nickel transport system substrate-binding protein
MHNAGRGRATTGVAVALLVALVLGGCGGGGTVSRRSQSLGSIDINPMPRDRVRDGGTLRLPMYSMPNNFNYNQIDGTSADTGQIDYATLPALFTGTADGGLVINHDYLTSAELTSTNPQVVTYTLNPKATWSDGSPLSWRDFQAYWQAQNGSNPQYQLSGSTGYDDIVAVSRGVDDRQAVITFGRPFAEWQNLFVPFQPASLTGTPTAFNTAWRTGMPVTAGPFRVRSVDQTAQTVTLQRDPHWWGTPAKLDQVIFKVYESAAEPDALANNELDFYEVGSSLDLLRRAQQTAGAVVRNAPSRAFTHLTFNGAGGAPLADLALRRAIAQGINRAEIARRMIGQIVPDAGPDGNHVYLPGSRQYQDNSGVLPYDPIRAGQRLDSLGWTRVGATRQRGGVPLRLRLVTRDDPTSRDTAVTVQNQLAQLGVTVTLQVYPFNQLIYNVARGGFDLALFAWGSTATPFSSEVDIYGRPIGNNARENYGRIGSAELDALFDQGNAEFDETKRAAIGNRADRLIWQEAHSVVLFARPGTVAVRANLANFGAWGLADWNFINAGFAR